MANPGDDSPPHSSANSYYYVIPLVGILCLIGFIGVRISVEQRTTAWLLIMMLLASFAVIAGRGVTGRWRGIFIDSRNKISLSRLQLLIWTLIVLSALFTAVLSNVALGWESPLEVQIPSQLWVLMGISTASAVGQSVVLATKESKRATEQQVEQSLAELETLGRNPDLEGKNLVVRNRTADDARWADLLMGDEMGNAAYVDVGKLQMLFFTFILAVGYGGAVGALFVSEEAILALPAVQDGMNVLLGISHTGYLAVKAAPHSKEDSAPMPDAGGSSGPKRTRKP